MPLSVFATGVIDEAPRVYGMTLYDHCLEQYRDIEPVEADFDDLDLVQQLFRLAIQLRDDQDEPDPEMAQRCINIAYQILLENRLTSFP